MRRSAGGGGGDARDLMRDHFPHADAKGVAARMGSETIPLGGSNKHGKLPYTSAFSSARPSASSSGAIQCTVPGDRINLIRINGANVRGRVGYPWHPHCFASIFSVLPGRNHPPAAHDGE